MSTPPTPFADRQSLEAELKALEKDIGYLERFRRQHSEETYGYNIRESFATVTSSEDNLNSDGEETSLNSLTLPDLVTEDGRPSLAAMRHMRAEDIDMFIQNMTVPPPPSGQRRMYKETSPVVELTTEDISAFIIPPPPGQQQMLEAGKIDREVLELRLPKDQMLLRGNDKISPKIASLQERISQFNIPDSQSKNKELGLMLHKDKFGYPVQNSSVSPSKDAVAQSQQSSQPPPEPSNMLKGQVQSKKEMFMKQLSSPSNIGGDLPPPPPPPRSTVPRHYSSNTLGRKPTTAPSSYQFGNNLVRSNSQDELVSSKPVNSAQQHKIPIKTVASKINGKLSSSTEDLGLKRSPISPSKLSMTSSSDSISSTASVNTVKSASPQEENPPSLPPRLSPTKVNIKPPIPPLASPEKSDFSLKIVSNSPFRNGQISAQTNGKTNSPSPTSPVHVPGSPKPVLPSRLSKPSSPTKASVSPSKSSPGRSLPQIPGSAARQPGVSNVKISKPAAPTPPGSPKPGLRSSSSPQVQRKVPQEPSKTLTATERLTGGRKLPIPPPTSNTSSRVNGTHGTSGGSPHNHTNGSMSPGNKFSSPSPVRVKTEVSSPKSILKNNGHVNGHRIPNGHHGEVYTNSEFDHDDSLEGTSVDDPESDNDALKQAGRLIVFKKAEEVVSQVVTNIRESRSLCTNGDMTGRSDVKFARSKELLTTESRQFVTASKLFVKSATESEGQLMECLNHCVHMIDRIGKILFNCSTNISQDYDK